MSSKRTSPITITTGDPSLYSDDEVRRGVRLNAVLGAEIHPDDPPPDEEQAIAVHRAIPDRLRRFSVRAHDGEGRLVGGGSCRIDPDNDTNPDLLNIQIGVDPVNRQRGVATSILARLVEFAEREARTRLLVTTNDRVRAGAAMAESMGGVAKHVESINRLRVESADRAQLDEWVTDGPRRAAEYELIGFDGRCPDEHIEGYVDLVKVLNTAPRDDLEVNDFEFTPEQAREHEVLSAAAGHEHWVLLARHRETGDYAGMHDVWLDPTTPHVAGVGLTAVVPEHRGHALGKWLKAAMMIRILDERPAVTEVRTENADSNDPMLGINRAMGYERVFSVKFWEIETRQARSWVDERPGVAGSVG